MLSGNTLLTETGVQFRQTIVSHFMVSIRTRIRIAITIRVWARTRIRLKVRKVRLGLESG